MKANPTTKAIKLRMNILLIIGTGSVLVAMYNLSIESDLFAIINFVVAGFAFYSWHRTKNFIDQRKNWRSFDSE